MIRLTRLQKIAVTLVFLITALTTGVSIQAKIPEAVFYQAANPETTGGGSKIGSTVSVNPVSGDVSIFDVESSLPKSGASSPDSQLYFVNFEDTVEVCPGTTIYDTLLVSSLDSQTIINLEQFSGPGSFVSTPSTPPVFGYYEFTPGTPGDYDVVFMAYNAFGDTLFATKTYVVLDNHPPALTSFDTTIFHCYTGEYFQIYLDAKDPDFDALTYRVLDGDAEIETATNALRFYPTDTGQYCFTVEVSDNCASDTAEICITALWDFPPEFNNPDLRFEICEPDTICFDITASDPNLGDSVAIVQESGPGMFTMTSNGAGTTCFVPDAVDSADYIFIYSATDQCMRGEVPLDKACPPTQYDTVVVTVVYGEPPVIQCPGDTDLFICAPDTICIPVGELPVGSITITPESVWYDADNQSVCFYTNCSVKKDISIVVETNCGLTGCEFSVDVTLNSPPLVMAPPDTSISLCEPEEICIPIGISDVDNNIASVEVTGDRSFNPDLGRVCFTPETSGNYQIIVTATDSCGAQDSDTINVDVHLNSEPMVVSMPDTSVFMCELSEYCFPVSVSDADDDIESINLYGEGIYSNGYVCFTPQAAGEYTFIVEAVDSCGITVSDTTTITIDLNSSPQVTTADDFEVFQCDFNEICFDVNVTDADNNLSIVSTNQMADYDAVNHQVCFTPDSAGVYEIIVTATDSCYATDVDTTVVTVLTGDAAIINCPDGPISRSICDTEEICEPLEITPVDADITVPDGVEYRSGNICFTPDTTGTYIIDVIASSECGDDSCQLVFDISVGETPQVICPADTTIQLCGSDQICLPVGITPLNANITVSPVGEYVDGEVCFDVDTSGYYQILVEAESGCGVDSCYFGVTVEFNDVPEIITDDTTIFACEPGETYTYMIEAMDDENDPITFDLLSDFGSIDPNSGELSFTVDTSGVYCFTVQASDLCNSISSEICITVTLNSAPVVVSAPDDTVFICEPTEYCFPVSISDADDNILNVNFSGYGTYNNGYVCFTPEWPGIYTFFIEATDKCGAKAADSTTIKVIFNNAPMVNSAENFGVLLCDIEEICFPVEVVDYDNNLMIVSTNTDAVYDSASGQVCYTPDGPGVDTIIVTATDYCYATGVDTTIVQVDVGESATITCPPEPLTYHLCTPEEICIPLDITPANATVIVSDGYYSDGELCFTPDGTGTYNIQVIAAAGCGADTCDVTFDVEIGVAPQVVCPADTSFDLCEPETICLPVTITPDNATVTVSPMGTYESGMICFDADASGLYQFLVEAETDCGSDSCTFSVDINMNTPPEIVSRDTSYFVCDPGETIEYMVQATDYDDDPVTFGLNTGFGQIDSETGLLSFIADTAGTYCFDVVAFDFCSSDTATVCITVIMNSAPVVISGPDTTVTACSWDREICIPVEVGDDDNNIASITASLGSYANGFVCFTPTGEGDYYIVTTAIDECNAADSGMTKVTVIAGQAIDLDCPVDTSAFICEPDTLCFPIGGIPDDAQVTVSPASAWYDAMDGTICFYTNCAVEKDLKVVVANDCGVDSCMFTVSVTMNSRPLVLLPPARTVTLCSEGEVCVPVGIADADDNIADISIYPESATYNPISGRICFTAATAGDYVVKAMAVDDCGSTDSDSTVITVIMNSAPTVTSADDFSVKLCEPSEICFPVEINDVNMNIQTVSVLPDGYYNDQTGEVCFTPQSAGVYTIETKVTDSCGEFASATTTVTVTLNAPPTISIEPYTLVTVCNRDPICLPLIVNDIDDNLDSVTVTGAVLNDGIVCLEDMTPGVHQIIVNAYDSCNAVAVDTAIVEIVLNSPPVVEAPDDFDVFQCVFEEICFDVSISDPDDNITVISTDMGSYDSNTGQVCFTPDDTGTYRIVITAVDDCQLSDADTIFIHVGSSEAAQIDCPSGAIAYSHCGPTTVCHPISFIPDNATISTIPAGLYENGQLCFDADTSGTYLIEVTAESECGTDVCTFEFDVNIGQTAQVTCPADTTIFLCESETICLPASVSPSDANITLRPVGQFSDDMICFVPDTAGQYVFDFIADNDCGSDSCRFTVDVVFNTPPVVVAGDDTSYFQCEFEEICRPVEISDADNGIDSVKVTPVGYYNSDDGTVCFTPEDTGQYCLTIAAYDECGAADSDQVCITVTSGPKAMIDCPDGPIVTSLCDAGEVCVPLAITPSTAEVSVSFGTYADGQICFTADTAGTYNITVIASEVCGDDTCQLSVEVEFDEYVEIICPDLATNKAFCEPSTVSILLPITPTSATVTVSPIGSYSFSNSRLTFFADTSGHYEITVIAESPCSADTCVVEANVVILESPQISCPGDIDTLLCFTDSTDLCFDVDLIGDSVDVIVRPAGSFDNGTVCVPITEEGTQTVTVVASSICGADSCSLDITVTKNQPPVLTVPEDIMVPWCDGDTGQVCIDGIFAVDPEGDLLTITKTCGPGTYNPITADSGEICFTPDNMDTTYEFCLEVDDGCSTDFKSLLVTVFPSAICSVCVDVSIDVDSCVVVGTRVPIKLNVQTNDPIAGFDLIISYDASTMSFLTVKQGDAIPDWEYFTYRLPGDGCGSGCPSGLLRVFGIADQNDGPNHPPEEQLSPNGTIATITMIVINDQTIGGQFLPMGFYWLDCGDNSFSDPSGNLQYVEARIYNASDNLIWEESDDVHYPESIRPVGFGTPDSCMTGDKIQPVRCVYFHEGGICVKRPDEIDDRGDINLNAVPYEIADAVIFTNYFIYGLAAFTINPDGQIAASDVNADGYALTVADLVYLIRVVVGDASAIPKVSPDMAKMDLSVESSDGMISINGDAHCEVGAGVLVFKYDGINPTVPELGGMAEGMDYIYSINNSEIRVLIYSMEYGHAIGSGDGNLLNIDYSGSGEIRLTDYSFATFHGEMMQAKVNNALVPDKFEVSQNYPNPFNPNTTIDLSLPTACNWTMTIFNINGQAVRKISQHDDAGIVTIEWDGTDDSGQAVASGVYLYRVETGSHAVSKKMILLK
jgi:hypothetical protein